MFIMQEANIRSPKTIKSHKILFQDINGLIICQINLFRNPNENIHCTNETDFMY